MTVTEVTVSLIVGILLGLLFYGGLWITVRRLVTTRHAIALTLGSLLLRMSIVLAGILFVSRGRWQNALACLLGLMAARVLVSRVWVCT